MKQFLFGYKEYEPLNHLEVPYNRLKAQDIIENAWGWRKYGEKHYENRYTRFLEAYTFPARHGIDKRIAHYSSLIASDQISRSKALKNVNVRAFDQETYDNELKFFLRKLDISMDEFDEFMNSETHQGSNKILWNLDI